MKLVTHSVEKPWGRTDLPRAFPDPGGRRIGELWFDAPNGEPMPLLVKYIFTSDRLSIQVHPSDAEARERGLPAGKSECWYILDAERGATLGLGTKRPLDGAALRNAALDGSIEELMDWKPVAAGDFFYVPAGTVHAIGAGITLVEIQQNSDVTYRLYDYGRPRELHLDDGVEVSRAEPYPQSLSSGAVMRNDAMLTDNEHFAVLRVTDAEEARMRLAGRDLWVVPIAGTAHSGADSAEVGESLWIRAGAPLDFDPGTTALVAAARA